MRHHTEHILSPYLRNTSIYDKSMYRKCHARHSKSCHFTRYHSSKESTYQFNRATNTICAQQKHKVIYNTAEIGLKTPSLQLLLANFQRFQAIKEVSKETRGTIHSSFLSLGNLETSEWLSLMAQARESRLYCRLSPMSAFCVAPLEQMHSRSRSSLGAILLVLVASWLPAVEKGHLFLVFSWL